MVTWPANVPQTARAFMARQVSLREKLRWARHGSRRRKQLEAELAELVREELRRETEPQDGQAVDLMTEPKEQWWQR